MTGRVLYVDPSYTGTGLFLLNYETATLSFGLLSTRGKGDSLRFQANYFLAAKALADSFASYLHTSQPSVLKIETPPPFGQTAAGLTGLNYLLLDRARDCPSIERIELITSSMVAGLQKRYFGEFADRSKLAREFLRRLGLRCPGLGTVNPDLLNDNDVATAFLFYCFEKVRRAEARQDTAKKVSKKGRKGRVEEAGLTPPSIFDSEDGIAGEILDEYLSPFTVVPTVGCTVNAVVTTTQDDTNRVGVTTLKNTPSKFTSYLADGETPQSNASRQEALVSGSVLPPSTERSASPEPKAPRKRSARRAE